MPVLRSTYHGRAYSECPRVPFEAPGTRMVNGMPLRNRTTGENVMSANTREKNGSPEPALNGVLYTAFATKLCRMSYADKPRSRFKRVGKNDSNCELKSTLSSIALLNV